MSLEIKLLKIWLDGKIELTEYRLSQIDEWDNKYEHNYWKGKLDTYKEVREELE